MALEAGFETFLEGGGGLQLRSDFLSYTLVKSGSFSNGNFYNPGQQGVSSYEVPIAGGTIAPIIFFKARGRDSRVAAHIVPEYNGAGGTTGNSVIRFYKWWNIPLGDVVDYYVFSQVIRTGADYGLQLFDANSNLTFDSTWNNMYVMKVYEVPKGQPTYAENNYPSYVIPTGVAGSNFYAVGLATPRQASLATTGNNGIWGWALMDAAYVEDNNIKINWVMIDQDDSGYGPISTTKMNDTPLTVMLVDIRFLPLPYG